MSKFDQPLGIEEQILTMKKYVTFTRKVKMRRMINYTGYFRTSRYGKYLLSYTSVLKMKPNQELLFEVYDFDTALRKLLFQYCKRAEIQFKSHLSNSVSIKVNEPLFYLAKEYYTPTKSENDKIKRESNKKYFYKFINKLIQQERDLRKNVNKYPELKEYRNGGQRFKTKLPSWAAFSYFELGTINNIYGFLKGDLRKHVLSYGYTRNSYGKEVTKQMDTWLDAIRNLRNVCAHHNKLVGRTSSVVLFERIDGNLDISNTDLFSRLYALKKVLNKEDSDTLKIELIKLIRKAKFDVYKFEILPENWEEIFDRINYL